MAARHISCISLGLLRTPLTALLSVHDQNRIFMVGLLLAIASSGYIKE